MARQFAAMELVLIAIALSGLAPAKAMEPTPAHEATAQLVSDAKSEYLRKLAAYQAARQAFEELRRPIGMRSGRSANCAAPNAATVRRSWRRTMC
jgi:hypothetical protein